MKTSSNTTSHIQKAIDLYQTPSPESNHVNYDISALFANLREVKKINKNLAHEIYEQAQKTPEYQKEIHRLDEENKQIILDTLQNTNKMASQKNSSEVGAAPTSSMDEQKSVEILTPNLKELFPHMYSSFGGINYKKHIAERIVSLGNKEREQITFKGDKTRSIDREYKPEYVDTDTSYFQGKIQISGGDKLLELPRPLVIILEKHIFEHTHGQSLFVVKRRGGIGAHELVQILHQAFVEDINMQYTLDQETQKNIVDFVKNRKSPITSEDKQKAREIVKNLINTFKKEAKEKAKQYKKITKTILDMKKRHADFVISLYGTGNISGEGGRKTKGHRELVYDPVEAQWEKCENNTDLVEQAIQGKKIQEKKELGNSFVRKGSITQNNQKSTEIVLGRWIQGKPNDAYNTDETLTPVGIHISIPDSLQYTDTSTQADIEQFVEFINQNSPATEIIMDELLKKYLPNYYQAMKNNAYTAGKVW